MAFVNPWAYYNPKDSVLAPNFFTLKTKNKDI